MDATPAFLAALASAAVPGLDPISVEALPSLPEHEFDVAFVEDSRHRRWVVRSPRNAVAAARLEAVLPLLDALATRLPFEVPKAEGFATLKDGGRAMVSRYLPGHNLDLAELPTGAGLAVELGRALAAIHELSPGLFADAGVPTHDSAQCHSRQMSLLDRVATTGRVPTALLQRWERALEDVALWQFAPTPVHGDLTGDQILAVFAGDDTSTGRIGAVTGWEDARVGDPADDFADLVALAPAPSLETVFEAYANARLDRPDRALLLRARLGSELALAGQLASGLDSGDRGLVDVTSTQLHRLADDVELDEEHATPRFGLTLPRPATRSMSAAQHEHTEEIDLGAGPPTAAGPVSGDDEDGAAPEAEDGAGRGVER